jgi:ATP-binding cassette, subfamily F, member 3
MQLEARATAASKRTVEPASGASADRVATTAKVKRKRRFPYRKVEDLEAEIAHEESHLRETERLLASPDLYRDGERVKAVSADFEQTKARLAQLYEHWEEAVELN